jgi:hypothetical protein
MTEPFIMYLCPTYKRPEMLCNVVACFERMSYQNRHLLILDDANQIKGCSANKVTLVSQEYRFPNLSEKFNRLREMAGELFGLLPDIFAIMEDDDIYLPRHPEALAAAWKRGHSQFFVQPSVFTNYRLSGTGKVQQEKADGRFQASWAYTAELWDLIGGYPPTDRLDFDQQQNARCRKVAGATLYSSDSPSYVYRWGSGPWNGSQVGESQWRSFWEELGKKRVPDIPELIPEMDKETVKIFNNLPG